MTGLTASGEAAGELAKAKREHPYLFFAKGEQAKLRQRYEKRPLALYRKAMVAQAEDAMETKPSPRRNRAPDTLQALLWAYHLTGEKKYRRRCMDWVRANWDRQRFGRWSETTTAAMAAVYDTLYPELTDEEKGKLKAYLQRALDQHVGNEYGWLYKDPSNVEPVQCGAAGMAALALMWESPKARAGVKLSRQKLHRYADRCMTRDGGYIEGSLFWGFGLSHYLMFAHALHRATGDASLIDHARLKKQHRFVEVLLGGDGQFMPFSDTQPWIGGWPICADLGSRCDNELLLWLADSMAAMRAGAYDGPQVRLDNRGTHTALAVLLRSECQAPEAFPGLPKLTYLETMQWGVMRSSGELIPNLAVGVKGSEGLLSRHKQNDLGSFVLYAGGEMLLLDPGYYQGAAGSHTLPLLNGRGPIHLDSRIVETWQGGPLRQMTVDSSKAYGFAARRVRRIVVMAGDRAVVVLDDILPGGGLGCDGGMAPVVSDPPPPQQVTLQPGTHTLFIDATTNDPLYHFGAWYRFDLSFADAP
jgi:hypothetical protein